MEGLKGFQFPPLIPPWASRGRFLVALGMTAVGLWTRILEGLKGFCASPSKPPSVPPWTSRGRCTSPSFQRKGKLYHPINADTPKQRIHHGSKIAMHPARQNFPKLRLIHAVYSQLKPTH